MLWDLKEILQIRVTLPPYREFEHVFPIWLVVHEERDPGSPRLTKKLKKEEVGVQKRRRRCRRTDGKLDKRAQILNIYDFQNQHLTWQSSLLVRCQQSVIDRFFCVSIHRKSKTIAYHPQSKCGLVSQKEWKTNISHQLHGVKKWLKCSLTFENLQQCNVAHLWKAHLTQHDLKTNLKF